VLGAPARVAHEAVLRDLLPADSRVDERAVLRADARVAVAGFGKFSVSQRAARQGRNPATGETINIAASKAAKFSAASALKKRLNP